VVVFLNSGARRTNLLIIGRKDMFFSRDLPVGGFAFTEEIMKKLGVKYNEAEEIKKSQGVGTKGLKPQTAEPVAGPDALALAERSALERLGDEINRSLRYYVKETGQSFFHRIEMVGGSAVSPEIAENLNSKFSIEVRPYDPFAYMEGVQDVRYRPQYAAAVGLAFRAQGI
jgi:type IV pilus assembly protein PilM